MFKFLKRKPKPYLESWTVKWVSLKDSEGHQEGLYRTFNTKVFTCKKEASDFIKALKNSERLLNTNVSVWIDKN